MHRWMLFSFFLRSIWCSFCILFGVPLAFPSNFETQNGRKNGMQFLGEWSFAEECVLINVPLLGKTYINDIPLNGLDH